MVYNVEYDPENNVIVTAWLEGFNLKNDFEAFSESLLQVLEQRDHPVGVIYDMTAIHLGFNDVIASANTVREANATIKHPNVGSIVVVSGNQMIRLAAQGMDSLMFGNMKMDVTTTREEAIELLTSN